MLARIAYKSESTERGMNPADWKADQWVLGIMNPERYRETKRTEITGANGGPVVMDRGTIFIPPESDE